MEIINNNNITSFSGSIGVGLGNFDGLHIGHMALIDILINECILNSLHPMIYTFSKHPSNILSKNKDTLLLMTLEKKAKILSGLPIEYLFYEEFNETFSKLKPREFIKNILVDKLRIKLAVAGFDYTFGYKGQGDAKLLKEMGEEYGFQTVIIPPIKVGEDIISSTSIRKCISSGDMEGAFYMLGRHYSILGTVETGYKLGTKLGFPTANIIPANYLLIPSFGVYITKTVMDGKVYDSITNIGIKPTIEPTNSKVSVETHILNFEGDIYEKPIEVYFLKKLRDETRFKDKYELANQIKMDILKAQTLFSKYSIV